MPFITQYETVSVDTIGGSLYYTIKRVVPLIIDAVSETLSLKRTRESDECKPNKRICA